VEVATATKTPSFDGVSPALRAVLGHLAARTGFSIQSWDFTGRFDDGQERVIKGQRVDHAVAGEVETRWLADVEGEVWLFSETNAGAICACSAGVAAALAAFRSAVPLRWSLVI
jgi:hypothetical protein